ncbi:MAG: DNA mismatch repair endonuclease MutL [Anaerolineales bacterium]
MPIHLLPPEIASQIAAGEVVERPASVVKELVENALDAGAGYISITVAGAGKRLIEVSDDGAGIPAEELPLAVQRHATSKLKEARDLFQIDTLGFRGEALASIGSISRMTITSRPVDSQMGARLQVDGGQIGEVEPLGTPVGSVVRVEDLFYNVPARLKFLKHDTTERRHIDNLVTRYALAYPDVRFHLQQEGRPAVQTSGNGDRREVLGALYGADIARQMLEVLSEDQDLRVTGFISPTSLTRSNRREIIFYINGRPVQDASLTAALLKAYHTLLMVGRYPMAVVFIDIPPKSVDVNVHPTKAEVRFRDQQRIFSGVQHAIRRALLAHTPVQGLPNQLRWSPESGWGSSGRESGRHEIGPAWQISNQEDAWPIETEAEAEQVRTGQTTPLPDLKAPILRLIGQIASTYLIAEGPDGLYLVDQHAAHERVLFERFMSQRENEIPAQTLLQPAAVEMSAASARLLSEQLPTLERIGFEVEIFGPNTFLVRAIPTLIKDSDPTSALRALVEEFEEDETPLQSEAEARIIARVCKRAAVKAGQTLSEAEQQALLRDLENCQSPRTCPHGRPTMIHLSVDLLERQFGRRGAR